MLKGKQIRDVPKVSELLFVFNLFTFFSDHQYGY